MRAFFLVAALAALTACHSLHGPTSAASTAASPRPRDAKTDLIGASGNPIGTADFRQGPNGLLIEVNIYPGGLAPGWHGVHLHAVGDCSDPGAFQKSGGHHGKTEGGHGLANPAGPEAGDLPNLWAGPNGAAGYEAFTTLTELTPAMDDADGLSIIIHAGRDDQFSQPIGGAGARVACGNIR
jgi:Cu-Zn family superoxide dismutase